MMKKNFALAILIAPFIILSLFTTTSCKKTVTHIVTDTVINTVTDTLIKTVTDTLLVPAKDTVFAMDTSAWNCFSFNTLSLEKSGANTYTNSSGGIMFYGEAYRTGARLQIKSPVAFDGKVIYYKWLSHSAGQASFIVPEIKYDPFSKDNIPPVMGVDLSLFSQTVYYSPYTLVQDDVWYYTRVKLTAGSDVAQVITSSGNYDNQNGVIVLGTSIPFYTKKGYIAIRIGDVYAGSSAYCVLGECKIASN